MKMVDGISYAISILVKDGMGYGTQILKNRQSVSSYCTMLHFLCKICVPAAAISRHHSVWGLMKGEDDD